jgi:hypothetical protein
MPDTAADVLAPNAPPLMTPDSDMPNTGMPPIASNPTPISTQSGDPLSEQIPLQTTPAYQDPEMVAGAHHQSWLAHVMDTVGNILGGDTTLHVTKKADGSVEVTHDPSTEGEKWGRVAAAALGGAAHGLAVGQGPGGPARAAAAGTQYGLQQPQQRLDEANKEASVEQERMMRGANIVRLNQEIVRGAWDNAHLEPEYLQHQADVALDHKAKLDNMGAIPVATNVTDHDTLMRFGVSDPKSVQAHMGQNGEMLFNEPDGKGGVNFYRIPADVAKQRTTDDDHWTETRLDPNDPTKTIEKEHVTKAGMETNEARYMRTMAQGVADDKARKQAFDAKIAQQKASQEKIMDTSGKAFGAAAQTNDQGEKDNFNKLGVKLLANEMAKAAAGRSVMTNQLAGPANDDALNLAADNYRKTGQLPAGFGRSPQTSAAIIARAAELDKQGGGEGIAANKANLKAYSDSLNKLQTNYQQTQAFENTALANMNRLQQTLKDIPDLGSRFANLPARQISAKLIGSDAMARFKTDLQTVQTEAAKVLNSSTGTGNLTDSARHELQDIIDGNAPISAMMASMGELRVDMNNRTQSYQAQIADVQNRIKNVGGTATQATPAAAAAPAAAAPNTDQAARAPGAPTAPTTAGPSFKAMNPPPNEPTQPGRFYGMGAKGLGWYK